MAIDEADTAPERPLLHLMNVAAEADLPVLLAGRTPPARWGVGLPDLASRLRAVTAAQIHAAEDELLRRLFARLLAERQIALPATLQDWLRLRLPRTPGAMREAAARLDRAALASGGRVTRSLAAAVLSELDAATLSGGHDVGMGFPDASEDSAQSPATGSAPGPDLL
jgi:chromosomal replication initiation ATPase DnaA